MLFVLFSDVTMDDDDDEDDMFMSTARSGSTTNGRLQPLLPGSNLLQVILIKRIELSRFSDSIHNGIDGLVSVMFIFC